MRTYWTDTRDTRIITPLSHTFAPIEPPFPATPGHITASYHVKASGLELVSHGTTFEFKESNNACAVCGQRLVTLKTCTRCEAVFYCSKACQKQDYKQHKKLCKDLGNA